MASSLMPLVLQAALFTSLAIVLLLAARTLLRRQLGASLAYQAWLLVPLVVLATLLPQRPVPQLLHIEALRPVQALAVQAAPNTSPRQTGMLLSVWACGALAAALRFVIGHHAFLRRAGRLKREGEVYVGAPGGGPASLALLAAGAFGATLGARAEQAASTAGPRYSVTLAMATASAPDIAFTLKADSFVKQPDKKGIPRILAAAGEQFAVASGEWRVEMTVRPGDAPDQVWLAGKLFKGTSLVSEPRLLTRIGEPATVKVGDGDSRDFSVIMTVTPQA